MDTRNIIQPRAPQVGMNRYVGKANGLVELLNALVT